MITTTGTRRLSPRSWFSQARLCIVGMVAGMTLVIVLMYRDNDINNSKLGQSPLQQSDNWTHQVLPHCIIAGVKKCGTRALLEFLRGHSHLQLARYEIHYFDRDKNYDRGLEWYLQQMPGSEPHQLTMEKTPDYFHIEASAQRVHNMNSSICILFIVRDPVTRMISDYVHWKQKSELPDFEKLAIDAKTGQVNMEYEPLDISTYHKHLSRWLRYFNWTQIHIVDGDALIRDPLPELSKVEDFLGIEHQFTEDMFYFDSNKGFYCQRFPGQDARCLGDGKGRPHPTVQQETLDTLCAYFRPHNEIFFKMTGQQFDWC